MGDSDVKDIKGIADLQTDPVNANSGTPRGQQMVEDSLRTYGAGRSILVDKHGVAIAGNRTLQSASDIDLPIRVIQTDGHELVVVQRTDLDLATDPRARELGLVDNRSSEVGLSWNIEVLASMKSEGVATEKLWTEKEWNLLVPEKADADTTAEEARKTLSERFLVPPFSVLDARQGYWQDRKRAWIALGIQSELGRGGQSGTSARAEPGERPTYRQIRGGGQEHLQRPRMDQGETIEGASSRRARQASPGGSPRPAMKLKNGHTVRGDGRGREI